MDTEENLEIPEDFGLKNKQKVFCDEYLKDLNGTQAAIRAGYSQNSAETTASRLLRNGKVEGYIKARLKAMEADSIATTEEILTYLTKVMRGESESEVVMMEGQGEGVSVAVHILKKPDEKERLKAAEHLGKYLGLASDSTNITIQTPVFIKDDLGFFEDEKEPVSNKLVTKGSETLAKPLQNHKL